jgi:hypothetical protein
MAQSVAISDDGGVADGSAILEVKSTTKGFLPPRMTLAQRRYYSSSGLQIWCTDCGLQALCFYTGSEWSTGITSEQVTQLEITLKVGITQSRQLSLTI